MNKITKIIHLYDWCENNKVKLTVNQTETELDLKAVLPDGFTIRRTAKLSSQYQVAYEVQELHKDLVVYLFGDSAKILSYTRRDLEIAYCCGLLNRVLTADELSKELESAKEKLDLVVKSIDTLKTKYE